MITAAAAASIVAAVVAAAITDGLVRLVQFQNSVCFLNSILISFARRKTLIDENKAKGFVFHLLYQVYFHVNMKYKFLQLIVTFNL